MRNLAIAVAAAGTPGGCRKPAPDPAQPKADLTGNWRRSDDGNADFIEIELKAGGTYFMDTGRRCKNAPCPSTREGKWTHDSVRKLTIGEHTYDADLKLAPKKQLRLLRHDDRKESRAAMLKAHSVACGAQNRTDDVVSRHRKGNGVPGGNCEV